VLGEQLVLGRGPRGRARIARVFEPAVGIMNQTTKKDVDMRFPWRDRVGASGFRPASVAGIFA
jgi:hypothetical protein